MSDSGRVRAQFVAFLEAAEAGSEAALQSLRAFVAESDEAAELLCEDDALAVRFALVRSSRPPLSVGCRAAVPSPSRCGEDRGSLSWRSIAGISARSRCDPARPLAFRPGRRVCGIAVAAIQLEPAS